MVLNMMENNIIRLLSQDNYIMYSIPLAHTLGVYEAILIGELARKWNYWDKQGKLEEDNSFYITQEDIEADTGLTPYQQRKTFTHLVNEGIIEVKLKGMPAVNYYKLLDNKLLKYLTTRCEETSQQDVKKLNTTNTYINNTYITNTDINNKKETTKVVKKELDFTKEVQNEECCKREVIFYWIDHLDKGQEFRDALHYWLTTYKKTVSIKQMTNKLNRLYNLYTDERDQTECILQSADNGWQGFFPIKDKKVYQNNDFSNGQKNGRIRTIDTSAQEDQLEALAKVFGRNGG